MLVESLVQVNSNRVSVGGGWGCLEQNYPIPNLAIAPISRYPLTTFALIDKSTHAASTQQPIARGKTRNHSHRAGGILRLANPR